MARFYESEITRFIRDLQSEKPHLPEEQRKARAFWWDRKIDYEEQRRLKDSAVPQSGYVYYDKP